MVEAGGFAVCSLSGPADRETEEINRKTLDSAKNTAINVIVSQRFRQKGSPTNTIVHKANVNTANSVRTAKSNMLRKLVWSRFTRSDTGTGSSRDSEALMWIWQCL